VSYQVLARKWRPRIFREMVGQEHVLKALINALDHNRLHHAYLFTGTRGVGKTTIARILAKCLNCEKGVTSEPCGQCSSCTEIAEGRFIDLIEVDAASRTRVEDTRELLDNVQYAPTRGRYKIYLIDEVHMLSTHSFNALLKTLEEPPEHVKFLLATTDPQKLPVTILSRCLQFNLKNMSPERIVGHLQFVLEQEALPFEEPALWQLARSADGSMRDALSLTDQAIAYGAGKVGDADVIAMLGTIDHRLIEKLVRALIDSDGQALLRAVAEFAEHAPDYYGALGDLTTFLHRLAIAQAMPEALDNSYGDRQTILELCRLLPAEDVQLFYQTALMGRRDLHLSPDPRSGLEMTLLRMLAFKPQGVVDVPTQQRIRRPEDATQVGNDASTVSGSLAPAEAQSGSPVINNIAAEPAIAPPIVTIPVADPWVATSEGSDSALVSPVTNAIPVVAQVQHEQHAVAVAAATHVPASNSTTTHAAAELVEHTHHASTHTDAPPPVEQMPWDDAPADTHYAEHLTGEAIATPKKSLEALFDAPALAGLTTAAQISAPAPKMPTAPPMVTASPIRHAPTVLTDTKPEHWLAIFDVLGVKGLLQSTVANCVLARCDGNQLYFLLDQNKGALFDDSHRLRLSDLLSDYFGESVKAHIELAALGEHLLTPAMDAENKRQQALASAKQRLHAEPLVAEMKQQFSATLHDESVQVIQLVNKS
jgi:DNA polymerase-3 subunit gamma/tau